MRGADTFTESLFSVRRLDDFVPQNHPLRPVRQMVNEALKKIEPLLSSMYAADITRVDGPALRLRSCSEPCCCKFSTACALNAC